jgi:hypothetical protein
MVAALLSVFSGLTLLLVSLGPQTASAQARCEDLTDFRSRDFPNPTRIDNPYFPLTPGSQFVLDGTSVVNGVTINHHVTFTVTDLTKRINGVRALVIHDVDFHNGVIAEEELTFVAQDRRGNIWTVGEYPEEYEDGVFQGAPTTWIAGLNRAKAGVMVPGAGVGHESFLQAFAPDIIFDCGRVAQRDQNTLVIDEWDPAEAAAHQIKRYARATGLVGISAVNYPEGETLTATGRAALSQRQLAQVRDRAEDLEKRAYKISSVYRRTSPMVRLGR